MGSRTSGAYPSDARYPPSAQPIAGRDPRYMPPAPYPPGQEPLQPRQRTSRRTPLFAPVLALLGLVLVAVASYWAISFLNAQVDESAAAGAGAEDGGEPLGGVVAAADATSAPDASLGAAAPAAETPETDEIDGAAAPLVIQAPPGGGAEIEGSILFSRGGDLWAASGTQLRRLTDTKSSRADSDPSWSGNGDEIYFVRTSQKTTNRTRPGGKYTLYPTDLMRIRANGGGRKTVYKSLIRDRRGFWFTHVLQPSVSPNGKNIAVVSDGADGNGSVILHVVNSKTGRMRKVPVPAGGFGHNDPDFSPDGTRIAYTFNDNRSTTGTPRIGIFTCQSKANCSKGRNRLLKRGYANPSWSPDGRLLAVEATDGTGRDIVVIGAQRGDVKTRLTRNRDSFAPVFSPGGDQIAYLRRDGTDIDLRVMTLEIDDDGDITLLSDQAVTTDGGVDGGSSPSWHVPRSQRTQAAPDGAQGDDLATADDPPAALDAGSEASSADEGAPPPPGA